MRRDRIWAAAAASSNLPVRKQKRLPKKRNRRLPRKKPLSLKLKKRRLKLPQNLRNQIKKKLILQPPKLFRKTPRPQPLTDPAKKNLLQGDIVINVGQKTSGDFDELFERAIEDGNIARDERDYTNAENIYRRAFTLKPRDSRAIYGLGNIFSDQQRWEEAERAYRQAILLEPNSPEAHIALSFVLTQPVVVTNLTDRYLDAEKMARKALQFHPENAVAYDQLGVALELRGIVSEETQNAYRQAIRLEPGFALAYAHLGRLLRRTGNANESSEAYRDAVRLATDVPTMILVAEVMQSQQRFIESEQLLRKALREDPKNPTALFFLGRALTTRGSFDEAEKVLKTSVDVSPNSFVSYALLGSLYTRRNKFEEAERILMKALQVISENERRRLSQEFEFVGDGFMKIGKGKDAARLYRQALSLDGDKTLLTNKLNKAQKS